MLAAAVERLATNPELLGLMQRRARESVQSLRWDRIAERTVEIYRAAIARRTRHATSP